MDSKATRTTFNKIVASERHTCVCAVVDERVVGFGSLVIVTSLWLNGPVGYIKELIVCRAHRRRGIGAALLSKLEAIAFVEWSCEAVELDSATNRLESHGFYEKRGFVRRGLVFTKRASAAKSQRVTV
jgi:ribosomal protein S18 acetylase RimI-like enzyme